MTENGKLVGQHPLVTRLLKGIYQTRPTMPKYKQVWDVKVVLNYLSGLYPLEAIALKELTYKVVMLMLLASGQRGQTIHLLDLRNMNESKGKITFLITDSTDLLNAGRLHAQFLNPPQFCCYWVTCPLNIVFENWLVHVLAISCNRRLAWIFLALSSITTCIICSLLSSLFFSDTHLLFNQSLTSTALSTLQE